jgi:hypothetical protein
LKNHIQVILRIEVFYRYRFPQSASRKGDILADISTPDDDRNAESLDIGKRE